MPDGDDDARRFRRTRRHPSDDGAAGAPATGAPPAAPRTTGAAVPPAPMPPGTRRVRGGPVPRRPGEPPPAPRVPNPPATPPPGTAGSASGPALGASGPVPRPATAPPTPDPAGAVPPRPDAGRASVPHVGRRDAPAVRPADAGAAPGAVPRDPVAPPSGPPGAPVAPGPGGTGARPGAPGGATAAGPGRAGRRPVRSATDSRVTGAFDAIVPRRRRRRYADDPPVADAPTALPPEADAEPADVGPADVGPADVGPADVGPADAGRDRTRRRVRAGAAALAVLVVLTTAWGFVGRGQIEDGIRTVAALDPASDAISDAAGQVADRNVLVVGLQADRGPGAPEAARTDTAVLVHQPAGDAQPVTLAIPATLEVNRPPCRRWDPAGGAYGETVPAESRTAFATAYDVGGPACTVGVVQQLTGMPVTGFVATDLAGIGGLVDAVGGVEVCTERPVVDPALGPIVPAAGDTTLDGATAGRFAAAVAVADSSPAARVQRQQRVLGAALGTALSTPSLLTPGAPGRAADGLAGSVVADGLSAGEILTLAGGLGRAGTAGDGSTPTFLQVPVGDIPNTRGHLEMVRGDARELFDALREHEPLPAEATAPQTRAAATAPAGTTVDLVDAAGRPGLMDEVAASLRERGYTIGAVTSGPVSDDTAVRYSPDRTEAAGALARALPAARPAPDPTGSGDLEVVVGAGSVVPGRIAAADDRGDVDCG